MHLTNQDIWLAYPKLVELSKIPLPVQVGLQLSKLQLMLQTPYIIIEMKRREIVGKYGTTNTETNTAEVNTDNPQAAEFAVEFGGLLVTEWPVDFQFEKVRLPLLLVEPCPCCKQEIGVPFIIDPQTLLPLRDYFVEVIET